MIKIKDFFKKTINNIKDKNKTNLISFFLLLIIVVILLIFFGKNATFKIGISFNLIMIGIVLLLSFIFIGKAFMGALVKISAGLSLLIFLGQSYCSIPIKTEAGNSSLKLILLVGLIYLIFDFLSVFIDGTGEFLETFKPIKKDLFWKIAFIIVFYVSVVGIFIFALYQVVNPIILNLCIF